MDIMDTMIERFREAMYREERTLCLEHGFRYLHGTPVMISAGGTTSRPGDWSVKISDAEIAAWEAETGKTFVENASSRTTDRARFERYVATGSAGIYEEPA